MVKTLDIDCVGYAVKTDIYEGASDGPVFLSLIGRTSRRDKQRYYDFLPRLAEEFGITSVIFDYSGHGDSPFNIEDIRAAQHLLEVVTVFDWITKHYPGRDVFVAGSSYGGFMALHLIAHRHAKGLILRAPAIYRPQDFYTPKKLENSLVTDEFRKDSQALAKHPLLLRASNFKGRVLLIVHARDEQIPKEVTDAYANAFQPEIVTADVSHSLDDSNPDQLKAYNQIMYDWLKQATSS